VETVRLLLERGADVHARDTTWKSTPLVWASEGRAGSFDETARVLIEHGADARVEA
jgi:ankyrin repeat protein